MMRNIFALTDLVMRPTLTKLKSPLFIFPYSSATCDLCDDKSIGIMENLNLPYLRKLTPIYFRSKRYWSIELPETVSHSTIISKQ